MEEANELEMNVLSPLSSTKCVCVGALPVQVMTMSTCLMTSFSFTSLKPSILSGQEGTHPQEGCTTLTRHTFLYRLSMMTNYLMQRKRLSSPCCFIG